MKVALKPHERGLTENGRSLFSSGFSWVGFTTKREMEVYLQKRGWEPLSPSLNLAGVFHKQTTDSTRVRVAVIYKFKRRDVVIYYYRTFTQNKRRAFRARGLL